MENSINFSLRLNLVFILVVVTNISSVADKINSRPKRYIAFPEGSSFSVAICTTIGQIGNPFVDYMSYALNWGVSYDLPNETWVIQSAHGFKNSIIPDKKPEMQRRFRRNVYSEIEILLDSMGFSGKDCILRALCESRKFLSSRLGTMEEELVKKIFSLPLSKVLSREYRDIHEYDHAYRMDENLENCSVTYSKCGFSLIALAFGKHSYPQYM